MYSAKVCDFLQNKENKSMFYNIFIVCCRLNGAYNLEMETIKIGDNI